ncbi:primosomal protein N', partial [Staphylococcus xylosus]
VLEAMLPSAIKAKYSKAFEVIKGSDISESILKKFNKDGRYLYKDAQQNDDLNDMFTLMKENLVQEVTILSQNIKKKTQRAVAVIE